MADPFLTTSALNYVVEVTYVKAGLISIYSGRFQARNGDRAMELAREFVHKYLRPSEITNISNQLST